MPSPRASGKAASADPKVREISDDPSVEGPDPCEGAGPRSPEAPPDANGESATVRVPADDFLALGLIASPEGEEAPGGGHFGTRALAADHTALDTVMEQFGREQPLPAGTCLPTTPADGAWAAGRKVADVDAPMPEPLSGC
jgi:hypothetical protein